MRISLAGGIEREAIDRVLEGPDAEGWTPHEAALLRAGGRAPRRLADLGRTWETLAETYDTEQLMEATMVVGHYHMVASP